MVFLLWNQLSYGLRLLQTKKNLDKSIKSTQWKEGLMCALLGHPMHIRRFQIHCERSQMEAQSRHIACPGSVLSFCFFVNPCVCFTVTNSDYQPVILPVFKNGSDI